VRIVEPKPLKFNLLYYDSQRVNLLRAYVM
jgi:hypothetical protein